MSDGCVVIDHWDHGVPRGLPFNLLGADAEDVPLPTAALLEKYLREGANPACGNAHAGRGETRIIVDRGDQDAVFPFLNESELQGLLFRELPRLGPRVLVSAGHFMPDKGSHFRNVNPNSVASLLDGLACLQQLRSRGIESDLLITINDVTVQDVTSSVTQPTPTLSSKERAEMYAHFRLPLTYDQMIRDCRTAWNIEFSVYIVGENKLAERLRKECRVLEEKGKLVQVKSGYALAFDILKISEVAHGGGHTSSSNGVFISNVEGVSGRPKCVRAAARLSAIPSELGYSGYIQFLPVCARNAIEGFLIGRRLYPSVHYASVHRTTSCF